MLPTVHVGGTPLALCRRVRRPFLLGALIAGLGAAVASAGCRSRAESPFEPDVRAFETLDQHTSPRQGGVVFVGSSTIYLWPKIDEDFPRQRVLKRGLNGSHIADTTVHFDRLVLPHAPHAVVMYAGSNDIDAGHGPDMVLSDFQGFVQRVWSRLPQTDIVFISIAPIPARWAEAERVRWANHLVADYCKGNSRLHFVDVLPLMLRPDGLPNDDLFRDDGIHMNRSGYDVWVPSIRAVLDALPPVPGGSRRPHDGATP